MTRSGATQTAPPDDQAAARVDASCAFSAGQGQSLNVTQGCAVGLLPDRC